jgi:hypothetical protein
MEHPHQSSPGTDAPWAPAGVDLECLAIALEASWDRCTAYGGVAQPGNPALGQCYPTSRVVQFFYPEVEIARGDVWTGSSTECHFWNIRGSGNDAEWIDLSWKQFPPGSVVQRFELLDRGLLGDSPATLERCALLLRRVLAHLADRQTGPAAMQFSYSEGFVPYTGDDWTVPTT